MDLLGKIFVIDAKKRITLPEIKEHPWYNEPLAPGLHEAEEELAKEQAENAAEMERLKFNQVSRFIKIRLASRPGLLHSVEGNLLFWFD